MEQLAKNRLVNPNGRRYMLPLFRLLYCEKCGYKMDFKIGYSKHVENIGVRYAFTLIRTVANVRRRVKCWTKAFTMLYLNESLM